MDTNNSRQEPLGSTAAAEPTNNIDRRDFTKKALFAGILSSVTMFSAPDAALAWLDGKFNERDDLADALKVLAQTYSDTKHYPHKFNDGIVKLTLRDIDFVARKGMEKEFVDHYVHTLGFVISKYLKKGVAKYGKDTFLWGIFERTSCSYQLHERMEIKDGERTFPCPFKSILEHIHTGLGTYKIQWEDVCSKWCIPVWKGFAEKTGVKIKVKTGETCNVKVL